MYEADSTTQEGIIRMKSGGMLSNMDLLDHAKKLNKVDAAAVVYSTAQPYAPAQGTMDSQDDRRVRIQSQDQLDLSSMKDYPGTTKAPMASYLPPIAPRKLELHSNSLKSDERFL